MTVKEFLTKKISLSVGAVVLVFSAIIVIALVFSFAGVKSFTDLGPILKPLIGNNNNDNNSIAPSLEVKQIKKFTSEKEYKDYIAEAMAFAETPYYGGLGVASSMMKESLSAPAAPMGLGGAADSGTAVMPRRISETNVQTAGIDEPDIVKTDGKEIYFSPSSNYYWRGGPTPLMMESSVSSGQTGAAEGTAIRVPYPYQSPATKLIKAFPPSDLKIDGKIEKSGNLLLAGSILVVFSGMEITGYDVSNPASPQKKWNMEMENNTGLAASRLYKGKIYLVTQNYFPEPFSCIVKPLKVNGEPLSVNCVDIYHPVYPVPADSTYTGIIVDPLSGKVEKTVSFVGSSGSSVIYMSENSLYVTYFYYPSILKFITDFFKEKGRDLAPAEIIAKLEKLESYDISQGSKLSEFSQIWAKYENSLDKDERLRIENELTNRMGDYYELHKRELESTGIVKISLADFAVSGSGSVPGYPVNNFALDEYNGYLRIAVTVGERNSWGFGGFGSTGGKSANDVYVLDKDLKLAGKVQDMGLSERIYSARFVEDKGYVVTFRQTDPFYVLDLSDPQKPVLAGELKIPGFSSYLHPIGKDRILGIGQDNWRVKISLFDVSNPENPVEISKYMLDEGWTEVSSNYHAFLMDKKHGIFFLPGGQGGYIFSYKNDKLILAKAVSEYSVKRAIYLDDYLYILGDNKIIVLNENDWTRVNELKFE